MITNNSIPKVSIITPLLKIDSYFSDCAHSVFSQKDCNIEWIIVTSETVAKNIYSYNKRYTQNIINTIITDHINAGIRRNIGIKISQGKYILFLDSDDYFYDTFSVKNLVSAIESYQSKAVGASCLIDDFNKGRIKRNDLIIRNGPKKINFSKFQNESGFYRFIFLSSFLKTKNNFSNLLRFQDSLFLVKTLIEIGDFYVIPDVVYVYRKNYKKISWDAKMYKDHINGVLEVLEIACNLKYKNLIKKMLRNIIITTSRRIPDEDKRDTEFYTTTMNSRKILLSNFYAFIVAPLLYTLAVYKLSAIK